MVQKAKKSSNPKSKAKKVQKVEKPVEVPKVEVPKVEEPAPVQEDIVAPAPEVSETPYAEQFAELMTMADTFLTMARAFKAQAQKLEKQVHRDHKQLQKRAKGKRKRQTDPDAPPSGFAKPGPVSDELRSFLNLGKDELIARTAVTQAINAYCKEHNLQNKDDKRKIIPDAPMRKLLKLNKGDELTFFNLQTYLKVHFPNKDGVYPTA
jgi:chromatin remodeling complex protein RSC6